MNRPRHSSQNRRGAGMTLIEVTVSFSLLTLLLMGVFGVMIQSRQVSGESRQHMVARVALEAQLERMRSIANESEASFAALATILINNPTFDVPGLPPFDPDGAGPLAARPHGLVRVCLDETKEFFTSADGYYFGLPPFNDAVPYPAFGRDLDASERTGGGVVLTALVPGSFYRVLPVRVEIGWGRGAPGAVIPPQLRVNTVIAPKRNFRRG